MARVRSLVLPAAAVLMTAMGFWYSSLPSPAPEPSLQQVRKEAEQGGYRLITTDGLRQRYRSEGGAILLVDTRQPWEYRTGHIRGAVNFSMEPTVRARWQSRGPLAERLGDDKDRTIVFY